jgi:hypothetical protein
MSALEMEPMTITTTTTRTRESSTSHRIDTLILLLKAYMEFYPRVTAAVATCFVGCLFFWLVLSFRKPVTRNRLYQDYSKLDLHYSYQASEIDHWCLFGGNDKCRCDDFTEPLSREEVKDWLKTHNANVQRIDATKDYDVVFYGDQVVEGWNGMNFNMPIVPDGFKIAKYFNETFTKGQSGEFEGVALGLAGDVVRLIRCDE